MTELEALLALNAIPGLGNRRIKQLLEHLGSSKKVFGSRPGQLIASKVIPSSVAQNIIRFDASAYLKEELRLIKDNRIKVITLGSEDYPRNLKEIPDAPVILYHLGAIPERNDLAIAVVGSRRASVYGISIAEKFAGELAELGITVISGMARGIDAAAHRGALRVKGKTIAVLGSGLLQIYPPEHKKLFDQIAESGAVISEFPLRARPLAGNFPRRNRIISGLSLGVVVVEASRKSGALITSDFALEQGREVFAVPGKVDSPTAQGVNTLIKQGAKLISSVDDIIDELKLQIVSSETKTKEETQRQPRGISLKGLSDDELRVYNSLNTSPVHIDEISQRLDVSTPKVMSSLLRLELKRLVKQSPGKLFKRALQER